jgi:L-aspartate oxidase
VWGRRAALAGLAEPVTHAGAPPVAEPIAPPTAATRRALWEHAGIERERAGLEALLDDPHPIARLVARCALGREESRGAHHRTEFATTNPALDGRHAVVRRDERPQFESWT